MRTVDPDYLVNRTLKDCNGDIDAYMLHGKRKSHAEELDRAERRMEWLEVTPFEDLGLRTWAIWNCQNLIRNLKGHCHTCKKRW
jgi:hypothetical protein